MPGYIGRKVVDCTILECLRYLEDITRRCEDLNFTLCIHFQGEPGAEGPKGFTGPGGKRVRLNPSSLCFIQW